MKHLFYILCLFALAGCEILEEDISHKEIRVISPADGVTIAKGRVDFSWYAVEYATGYELTVVSPSFASASRVVLDTIIRADTLDRRFMCRTILDQGEYEWSVAGFNGGYTTRTEVRGLTVAPAEESESEEP